MTREEYTFILQLVENLDPKDSEEDDPDLPPLKPKESVDLKKQTKKQVGIDDAITIVKSNNIASLTVKVFIESLRIYLFNDDEMEINVSIDLCR